MYLRLGWDWLHVLPPPSELVKVDSGVNQVFQRNVRALRIGSLVKDTDIFADDRRKHDYRNMYLPRDAYKAYPKPKTAIMKEEEYGVFLSR